MLLLSRNALIDKNNFKYEAISLYYTPFDPIVKFNEAKLAAVPLFSELINRNFQRS